MTLSPGRLRSVLILSGVIALVACTAIGIRVAAEGPVDTAQSVPLPAQAASDPPVTGDVPHGLPRPGSMSVQAFEKKLFRFLNDREYIRRGWPRDKGVRDTGPYINGTYYGTHPAVRVFYSPEVIDWLENGRPGALPDGAMIIKEQYSPPAARHQGKNEQELWDSLESWTVMIKDSAGSHDGWFWSNPAKGQEVIDNRAWPFDHPISGFGLYCVRCHASTHTPGTRAGDPENEYTFASLRNIEGYPGHPLLFRVDDSWLDDPPGESTGEADEATVDGSQDDSASAGAPLPRRHESHPGCARLQLAPERARTPNRSFLEFFDSIPHQPLELVTPLPGVSHDVAVAQRGESNGFLTSNQCMSCHAGLLEPFGPTMFVPTEEEAGYGARGYDISPYGEWQWTPMGLAGRDPVFFAQLETETAILKREFPEDWPRLTARLTDTCLRCHGAMGKHQFDQDHPEGDRDFPLDHVTACAEGLEPEGSGAARYGALARDGISCMICHRMQPPEQPPGDERPYLQFFLEATTSGNLHFGKPGEIYGPFKDDEIAPYAMEHAIGYKPKHSEFLKSSQLCGTCHTISLPVVDHTLNEDGRKEQAPLIAAQTVPEFKQFHHHVEQATYLEWLNSEYENEFNPDNPKAKTCQDCHMSTGLVNEALGISIDPLKTRMAIIQDVTYPDAENLAPHDKLTVRVREKGYARHNFSGLNVFLIELFRQFDDVLGVRTTEYMTGSKTPIDQSIGEMLETARHRVVNLTTSTTQTGKHELTTDVRLENLVGHRFPSGVGFRRAFLEVVAVRPDNDGGETILWSSGRTNNLGVLTGPDGEPLKSEILDPLHPQSKYRIQPHYEQIVSEDQVQIYESLLCNANEQLTTSFLHSCERIKDNRLLPRGWSADGPDPALTGEYLKATHPDAQTALDPCYTDGSGCDEIRYRIQLPEDVDPGEVSVRVSLYYQAIPPYFLQNIFRTSPDGPATQRLYALLSHVDLEGTPIENWKLLIATQTSRIGEAPADSGEESPPRTRGR